ncbi:MAG TPA: hypothetical protein VGE30_03245 [Candidatus Saccharimonadales bacterium]
MWYEIVAATLGFFGSIIFSAGLIKSKKQILDENSTYFDANPYTTRNELKSQPYYMAGIATLITGFATSIGGNISGLFDDNKELIGLLVIIVVSLVGYFGMAIFYIFQLRSHESAIVSHRKKIFYSLLRNYAATMHGYDGKQNSEELFTASKSIFQKDLLEKAEKIPEPSNEVEMNLIQEIDATTSPYQFYMTSKPYIDLNDSKAFKR